MLKYWCVVCEECDRPIPLLEYDQTKLRRNPTEFEALCLSCHDKSRYHEADVDVYQMVRVRTFAPTEGFYKITA
jgi:RNase P subunit RPR2